MTLSNLLDELPVSFFEKVAIECLTDALCDICMSDKVMCPVNRDTSLCPCDVIEKAQYEYYNGCD